MILPHPLQNQAAEQIIAANLSSRQAESLAKELAAAPKKPPKVRHDVYIREAEEKLTHALGTKVKITSGKKKSNIRIEFYSAEDLSRLEEGLSDLGARAKIEALHRFSQQSKSEFVV